MDIYGITSSPLQPWTGQAVKKKKGWTCLTGNWKQQIKESLPFSVFERLCLFGSNSTVICNVDLKYSEWTQGSSKKCQPSGQKNKQTQEIPMQSRNWTFTTTPPNYNRNSNKSQNEVFLKFLLQSAFMWQQNYVSKAAVHWSISTSSWETSVFHNIKEEEHCGCSPILLLLLTHVVMTDMRHFCDNARIQILKTWCWLIKELLARSVNTHTGINCLALLLIAGKKPLTSTNKHKTQTKSIK